MMAKSFIFLCCLFPALASAQAMPWRQLELVGQAQLNFFLWPVYEARLFSSNTAFSFPDTLPFALELEYKRQFTGQAMVEETRRQWQAIGFDIREDWLEQLEQILTNVSRDDVITLYADKTGQSIFYINDRVLGIIKDPAFTEQFAAIWLSEKTTRPGFRETLLRSI